MDVNPWRVKIVIDPRTIVLAWQRFGQGEKVGGPDEKKEDP